LSYTVKKVSDFSVPSRDVNNQTLLGRKKYKLFPAKVRDILLYTVKKVSDFPVPSRDVNNQTLLGREKYKLFPAKVRNIPAGDGKLPNFF
jgi:hypothetical protein